MRTTQTIISFATIAALLAACSQTNVSSSNADYSEHTPAAAVMEIAAPQQMRMVQAKASSVRLYGKIQDGIIIQKQPENTERYGDITQNPVHTVAQSPVSTFSVDVDTGSYANVRRFLNHNQLPPSDAVRVEELINYFDYGYAQPTDGKPFAVHTEVSDSPWQPNAKLIRIGIKAQDIAAKQLPPANLVFLVDVSGSMDSEDKLPLVKKTLQILTEQLRPQDKTGVARHV